MNKKSAQVFLPPRERCFERLRLARFGETETCVHCGSDEVVKRGTTGKDIQQYWCKDCETYFNDLTDTIFGQHRFALEEMFYIVKVTSDLSGSQRAVEPNRSAVPATLVTQRHRARVHSSPTVV